MRHLYHIWLLVVLCSLAAMAPRSSWANRGQVTSTPRVTATLARINTNNVRELTLVKTFRDPTGWVDGVAFSPDGAWFAGAQDGGNVYIWKTTTADLTKVISYDKLDGSPGSNPVFSPAGQLIVSNPSDFSIDVWNLTDLVSVPDAKPKWTLRNGKAYIRKLAVSPEGGLLVSLDDNGIVRVWNLETGVLIDSLQTSCQGLGGLAVSPHAQWLAVACGSLTVWNVKSRQVASTLPGGNSAAFSPDGSLLAFDHGSVLQVRQLDTLKMVFSLHSETAPINTITFSPDGSLLVAGSAYSRMVLWEATTGNELAIVDTGGISSIVFSPDMTILATSHLGSGIQQYINWWSINSAN